MPQGPAHLHEKWGDDWKAWSYLKDRGFRMHKGIVFPPVDRKGEPYPTLDEEEASAIDYLFMEWDWGYEPLGPPRAMLVAPPVVPALRDTSPGHGDG